MELRDCAADIAARCLQVHLSARRSVIVGLQGELGAGKTAFARALGGVLGVTENINSPTFNLLNEFDGAGVHLKHYDLYRLSSVEEIVSAGLADVWSVRVEADAWPSVHLIEWWQHGRELLERAGLPLYSAVLEYSIDRPSDSRRLTIIRHV